MRFAHLADCHIGSWRDPKLSYVSTEAFCKSVDTCIEMKVDFIIIAGDLFNTSIPGLDKLKVTAQKLRQLKDNGIPVYVVAGSHDYSPSGKTMLDVFESADLLVNVTKGEVVGEKLRLKFTVDKKTGAKITGVLGRRNMLERSYYESLDLAALEEEQGFKIFVFHSGLNEYKPKGQEHLDYCPISFLPKGFDYYAGGHVHMVFDRTIKDYGRVVYPGPLFPNSFSELEELHNGGFFVYDDGNMEFVQVKILDALHIAIDCNQKSPEKIRKELFDEIEKNDVQHKIVTIRLFGSITEGKIADIDFNSVVSELYRNKAYFVMKNTNKLETEEYEEIKVQHATVEEIEDSITREHLGQVKITGMGLEQEKSLIIGMMKVFAAERGEGERVIDFEKGLKDGADKIVRI